MMVHACNCSTGETEAEGAEVLRLSPLSTEFRDIGHLRYHVSKNTTQNKTTSINNSSEGMPKDGRIGPNNEPDEPDGMAHTFRPRT